MLAVLAASLNPTDRLRVGFIPFPSAGELGVFWLLIVSLLGSLYDTASNIGHLGHLGGLLYGLAYHQWAYLYQCHHDVIHRYRAVIRQFWRGK